jgi:hypothetical protein
MSAVSELSFIFVFFHPGSAIPEAIRQQHAAL